ncbi:MAG: serine protease [Enhydrobacter sp.]
MSASRAFRFVAFCALGLLSVLLPGLAAANLIPDSLTQVGAWKVGAYTRGTTTAFDHCSLYRVQSEGFAVAVALNPRGIWSLALEAPDWGLTPQESYVTAITVGTAGSYTFTGRAVSPRVMTLDVAPELFTQLKSGVTFSASANQRRYAMSLDGIEAASTRIRECVKQYAGQAGPPSSPPPSAATPPAAGPANPLVASIQLLLARLGYDPGSPIGTLGVKTNMAIAAFQKSLGEPGDGLPSEAVRAKLEKAVAVRSAAATPPTAAPDAPRKIAAASTGTGFYISPDTLITNFHVINGCAEIRIRKSGAQLGSARVVAASQSDDLAALRTSGASKASLKLRVGAPIKPAEAVMVFGYPLAGALSSTGNTTLGNVTALTGLRDDSRYIQISASVQPGNSGGPAVDDSGRLMGVVVSKLNAVAIARSTGDIPQNVNFAIKVSTLANFLEAHNIAYEADSATHELSNTQRAERTEAASTQLECWK